MDRKHEPSADPTLIHPFPTRGRSEVCLCLGRLGAAGGIGQPLSLLLKLNTRVTELALYDIRGGPGVAADISHVNTKSLVKGYDATPSGLVFSSRCGNNRPPGVEVGGTSITKWPPSERLD
ncbi:malate dehydrogenase [Trichoderma gamsii]|uniref:malate dehydrogenase n=1 Tax=Trichoderma gamsii TaxID=398673 RepID=A0A2P4Z6W1_9HYPO|nr:malate dehydrogenase [Trichoderma gamsii]PON20025.1 malate dehydrogenase [Trichoderma gamsii]